MIPVPDISATRCRFVLLMILLLVMLTGCLKAEAPQTNKPTPPEGLTRPAELLLLPEYQPSEIKLPRDDGPHDRLTEWWYYTGHLRNDSGDLFGFQFVIFQVLRSDFAPVYAAHMAVTDAEGERFYYEENIDTGEQADTQELVHLTVGEWELRGGDGVDEINAMSDAFGFDLNLTSLKPPVFHGETGFLSFGPVSESYYFSRTRMDVKGELRIGNQIMDVTGSAWMDRQWGDFLLADNLGWDWFSIQLDNNQEVMVAVTHTDDQESVIEFGTVILESGEAIYLEQDDFLIEATEVWTSESTEITYPVEWTIRIPELNMILNVAAVFDDQELDTTDSTGIIYWEGMVDARGTLSGETVEGLGYVELNGYASGRESRLP